MCVCCMCDKCALANPPIRIDVLIAVCVGYMIHFKLWIFINFSECNGTCNTRLCTHATRGTKLSYAVLNSIDKDDNPFH